LQSINGTSLTCIFALPGKMNTMSDEKINFIEEIIEEDLATANIN